MRESSSPAAGGKKADGAKRVWSTPVVIHQTLRSTAGGADPGGESKLTGLADGYATYAPNS